MTIKENPRAIKYTGWDGQERFYLPYTVNDVQRLAKKLVFAGDQEPVQAFLLATIEAEEVKPKEGELPVQPESIGRNVVLDVLEPLLTEKYCSDPLTREEMEGDHFDMRDLRELLAIAVGANQSL